MVLGKLSLFLGSTPEFIPTSATHVLALREMTVIEQEALFEKPKTYTRLGMSWKGQIPE